VVKKLNIPDIHGQEYRFCLLVWENEPIGSGALAKLCRERLDWKTSTVYTVLKRLTVRGVLKNEDATVTSLISKEQVQAAKLDEMMDSVFEGSIPAFTAAFSKRRKLTEADVDALSEMVERYRSDLRIEAVEQTVARYWNRSQEPPAT